MLKSHLSCMSLSFLALAASRPSAALLPADTMSSLMDSFWRRPHSELSTIQTYSYVKDCQSLLLEVTCLGLLIDLYSDAGIECDHVNRKLGVRSDTQKVPNFCLSKFLSKTICALLSLIDFIHSSLGTFARFL